MMIRHSLKLAFRQLLANKSFSIINLVGLSIGITLSMLILMWAIDELSYDRFHTEYKNIYRVSWHAKYGANEWNIPIIPVPVGPTLEDQFPEVESNTQVLSGGMTFQKGSDFIRENNGAFIDKNFFNVFSVEFVYGDLRSVLDDPSAIILTKEMAQRYFPRMENPVGQELHNNQGKVYLVSGVVLKWPEQSHFNFDFLMPINSLEFIKSRQNSWGFATVMTYFRVRLGSDVIELSNRFDEFVQSEILDDNFDRENDFVHFPFQKLTDIHLRSNLEMDVSGHGDITYVYLFSILAIFILLLACINFINLSTARSVVRAKEVGIRKTLGSNRWQLIRQFFIEAVLYVLLAAILSTLLLIFLLPHFNAFVNKELTLTSGSLYTLTGWIAFLLFSSLTAGIVPALTISSFKSIDTLKGKFIGSSTGNWLRKSLVVSQFVISISLISGSMIIKRQMNFLSNQKLGFDKEQVLVINQASALRNQGSLFMQRLNNYSWVRQTSSCQFMPGDEFDSMGFSPEQPANFERTSINYNFVDDQFVDILDIKLLSGRNFDANRAIDSLAFIINNKAADMLGWKNPIGKELSMNGEQYGPVVGVVDDFHYASLHNPIEPLILVHTTRIMPKISVKISTDDMVAAIAAVENTWKEHASKSPINYSFLDENYAALYSSEDKMNTLFNWATVMAIFIACLGLYGLAIFNAKRRIKEIGIRKILGASVNQIIGLLAREYVLVIAVALLISIPFTYTLGNKWLMDFAYRANLAWWIFILAGMISLMIAGLTIAYHSIRIAYTEPVDSLRQE